MVAGAGYAAGRHGANTRQREDEQEYRLQELEAQQAAAPAAAAPAPAASSMDQKVEELKKLKELVDAGVLTQEEFDAQKAKILG
jgi:membrane protease subunit (stomatin/prohibitin family)